MLRAARPCLATTGGKLIALSSPYAASGALHELHRRHWGQDDSPCLVWQATAPEMNPTLSADYLDRMREEDPEAYEAEVLGQFRRGISQLFDFDALDACIGDRPLELTPARGTRYVAAFDASGGRRDAAALAIGHAGLAYRDAEPSAVVDLVRAWPAPHDPSV